MPYLPTNPYKNLFSSDSNSHIAWDLISDPINFIRMETVTICCKKPALLSLDEIFYIKLPKYKKHDFFKQMCGEMCKQVMVSHGYKVAKRKNPIKGKFFQSASKYEKK